MQASGKTIGILSAVVIGGLGLWYMTKDDEETLADTTPPAGSDDGGDADATACSDNFTCPNDKPYCVSGECSDVFPVSDEYTKKSGSPYPRFGVSNMWRDKEAEKTLGARAQHYGLTEAAKACSDDPNCIGFSYWPERYTVDWPKNNPADCSDDGDCPDPENKVLWETGVCDEGKCRAITWGRSYFYTNSEAPGHTPADWLGDSWKSANGGLTFSESVGPSHEELSSRRPRTDVAHQFGDDGAYKFEEHLKQVGETYMKKGYEDYKPSDSWNDDRTAKTTTSAAEDETPAYKPSTAPSGSGYVIADSSTTSETSW